MSYRGDDSYRGSSRSSYKSGEDSSYRHNDDRGGRNRSKERSKCRSRSRSRERKDRRRSRDRRDDRRSDYKTDTKVREMSISPQRDLRNRRSLSGSPSPPPPPMISKVSMEFKSAKPLKMTLNPQPSQSKPAVIKKPATVASVFNDASDEEPEEMPPEARMRMRNIGRDTPTSAGPNSYGKTKHGFCDQKAITQKSLKVAMEQVNPAPPSTKFPGTIYKLSQ